MSIAGVTSSGAQVALTAAQAGVSGGQASSIGPGNADTAETAQFDVLMQSGASGAPSSFRNQISSNLMPQQVAHTMPAVQMQPGDSASSNFSDLRAYGDELGDRFSEMESRRKRMMSSLGQSWGDPTTTAAIQMVEAADFGAMATRTLTQYQTCLAVAQAGNGVTHSLLNNQ